MRLVHSILWLSTVALMVHSYSYMSRRNGNSNTHGSIPNNLKTYNSKNTDNAFTSSRKNNENSQLLQTGKQTKLPEIPSPTTYSESDDKQSQGQQSAAVLQSICRKLCSHGNACPPECSEIYLDPWTFFTETSVSSGNQKSKRRVGLDGLTFEDYLFMRWLGRDISRRGLN